MRAPLKERTVVIRQTWRVFDWRHSGHNQHDTSRSSCSQACHTTRSNLPKVQGSRIANMMAAELRLPPIPPETATNSIVGGTVTLFRYPLEARRPKWVALN